MSDSDSAALGKAYISHNKPRQQEALNAFLVAAETLAHRGEIVEAELRFKQALKTAEKEFGPQSDQAILVLSIMAAFYHFQGRTWEYRAIECRLAAWQMKSENQVVEEVGALGKKFVQGRKPRQAVSSRTLIAQGGPSLKSIPPRIRKACQILGLSPEIGITADDVNKAWKKQMLESAAHPDLGGNTDEAVILNNAKLALMEHLESKGPNLSKRFNKQECP